MQFGVHGKLPWLSIRITNSRRGDTMQSSGFHKMATRRILRAVVFVLLVSGDLGRAQSTELNLSTDLTRLGIAPQNMEPNRTDLDVRPLFNAALDYVKSRRIQRVTLIPGSYYFLTPRPDNGRYAYAQDLEDVTFDFGGAHLYLRDPYRLGLSFFNLRRVVFQRFTVDYLEPPFTQVRLTDVQPTDRVLQYELLPGFRDPTDFNRVSEFPSAVIPRMFALVFRDGQLLANTGRMSIAMPLQPSVVRINDEGGSAHSDVVRTFRPGDTLIVFGRSVGGQPLSCNRCTQVTIRQVELYASGNVALLLGDATACVVDSVRVVPRPGTDRLISSLADGVMLSNARSQNAVRRSEIRGAGDDGISVNSQVMVFVDSVEQSSLIGQANWEAIRFPNGTMVSFVSSATGAVVGTARVIAQDPPDQNPSQYPARGQVRLSFDQVIPSLPRDSGVILAAAADRGEGTVVEDNLVADNFMARGIYVAGPVGVTVRNNTVLRGPGAGILVDQDFHPRGFSTAPSERIDVVGNRIEDAIRPNRDSHTGSQNAFGALQAITIVIPPGGPQLARSNQQIRFIGNIITGSGRSGIWAANVNGLTIQDNTIERSGLHASAPIYGWPFNDQAQLRLEFAQNVAVRDSNTVSRSVK